jgi:hypothetical protein
MPSSNDKTSKARSRMRIVGLFALAIFAPLGVLLAWMGVRSILHGFDEAAGLTDSTKGVYLLLGAFQLFGAAFALFALYRFARAWKLLPGRKEATPTETIRERALSNLKSAQSPRS